MSPVKAMLLLCWCCSCNHCLLHQLPLSWASYFQRLISGNLLLKQVDVLSGHFLTCVCQPLSNLPRACGGISLSCSQSAQVFFWSPHHLSFLCLAVYLSTHLAIHLTAQSSPPEMLLDTGWSFEGGCDFHLLRNRVGKRRSLPGRLWAMLR